MRRMFSLVAAALLTAALVAVSASGPARAADARPSIRALVEAPDKPALRALVDMDLDVTRVEAMTADVRLTAADLDRLRGLGYRTTVLTEDLYASPDGLRGGGFLPEYVSYAEAVAQLNTLASTYPSLTQLSSIGTSIEGRNIWALKISDNAAVDEDEPEVLILGNHHAREVISVIIPLHVATELLNGYGSNTTYTDWVDNREIWIVPTINPDGLVYVETTDLFWRKNRRGGYGVDLNRNYDEHWGYDNIGSSGSTSSPIYRGASPASEPETQAVQNLINSRHFKVHMSYHSHGNLLLWGPGYKPAMTVDNDVFAGFGEVVTSQNGYYPGNPGLGAIYITNGGSDDFAYAGAGHDSYYAMTPEVGTSSDYFNPPANRIPTLIAEGVVCAWEAIRYADRPEQLAPPGQPVMDTLPTDADGNYTVTWNAPTTADTQVTQYEIVEKTGPSVVTDGLEGGTGAFDLGGWVQSGTRKASGSWSVYSGQGDQLNHVLWTKEPYVVQPGDKFQFDAWYSIESNWDYAYAVLSTDGGRSFVPLAGTNTTMSNPNGNNADNGITGSSGGVFLPMSFDLTAWVGQPVWLGLRYYTDEAVVNEGFYADNLRPIQAWAGVTSLSAAVPGTSFPVAGKGNGTYDYAVRGRDAEGDWGYWSANTSVTVELSPTGIEPSTGLVPFALSPASPNPFTGSTEIRFSLPATSDHRLTVYDVAGRRVRTLSAGRREAGSHTVRWDGRSDEGTPLPSGVYFYTLRTGAGELRARAVLQR